MKGQIVKLNDSYGIIKLPCSQDTYYFHESSLVDCSISELSMGTYVDFNIGEIDGKVRAINVHCIAMEWLEGKIVEKGKNFKEEPLYMIYCEKNYTDNRLVGGRKFWFTGKGVCQGELFDDFAIGDNVRFQCAGYTYGGNKASMVSKKHLGYINFYNAETGKGQIDFKYKFRTEYVNNLDEFAITTENHFYFVSYNLSQEDGYDYDIATDITVINETSEMIFDKPKRTLGYLKTKKWLDGVVTYKDEAEKYFKITSTDNQHKQYKATRESMEKYCDFDKVQKGQKVSFSLDDESNVVDVQWLGYITIFPVSPDYKDESGRINCDMEENEMDGCDMNFLYFFKRKIIGLTHNYAYTKFKIHPFICGERKDIPINTMRDKLRYKVRFSLIDDEIYKYKAKHIHVIGIKKPPVVKADADELKDVVESNSIDVSQETGNCGSKSLLNYVASKFLGVNKLRNM